MVLLHIIILIVAVAVLIKSADYFVDSSSSVAKIFGVSEFIIGLTLVAIGTSLPEFASSIVASLKGQSAMAVGNVIGSNIANILLIVGAAAIFAGLKTKREMLDRDGMILVFVSIAFYWLLVLAGFNVFIRSPLLIRIGAGILLLMFVAYLIFLSKSTKHYTKHESFPEFVKYFVDVGFVREAGMWLKKEEIELLRQKHHQRHTDRMKARKLWHHLLIVAASCAGIIIGARFFITEAIWVAESLDVAGGVVGMTLVALGTSLPELTVSIVAAKKGLGNMVIGNILGSNIANLLFVGGAALLIAPAVLTKVTLMYTIPFMVFTTVLLLVFIRTGWQIKRSEGVIFLLLYVMFLAMIFKGMLV